jgi:hypothetical protein
MVTLMMRSNPFFVNYSADATTETEPEARALAVREPTTVGIVVTANNHLSPALPELSTRRRAQRRKRLRAAFAAAVDYAIRHQARLFVQAGDLFDTPSPTNQDRAFVAAALARLRHAGIPCVAVGGAHDLPAVGRAAGRGRESGSPLRVYAALEALHYFGASDMLRPRCYELGGLRVAVAGLSYDSSLPIGSDPLAGVTLDDEEGALVRADVGLLVLHAAVARLPGAEDATRLTLPTSLLALPEKMRVVVTGQTHQYAHKRLGERHVISCGASERMAFSAAEGNPGFAWLELGKRGVVRAEHIPLEPQPRIDVSLPVARLWPGGAPNDAAHAGAPPADVLDAPLAALNPTQVLRLSLGEVCTDETMVRVRLCGTLTREQHRQLSLAEMLSYGRRHAFSFELDTSDLLVRTPIRPQQTPDCQECETPRPLTADAQDGDAASSPADLLSARPTADRESEGDV